MNTAWKKMDGVSSQKMSLDHYLPQLITRLLVGHSIGQIHIDYNEEFLIPKLTLFHTYVDVLGSSGIWTRDLSHPKRESYP